MISGGVCKNTAGTYECTSCSVSGNARVGKCTEKRSKSNWKLYSLCLIVGMQGSFVSHYPFEEGVKRYSKNMDKQWYVKVSSHRQSVVL